MVQLLGWTGGCIVLCVQPNLSSDFVGGCRASPAIIVLCHLICSMLESSFRLVLHLGHLLGKVICSIYSGALVGSEPIHGCWPESSLNGVQQVVEWTQLL